MVTLYNHMHLSLLIFSMPGRIQTRIYKQPHIFSMLERFLNPTLVRALSGHGIARVSALAGTL